MIPHSHLPLTSLFQYIHSYPLSQVTSCLPPLMYVLFSPPPALPCSLIPCDHQQASIKCLQPWVKLIDGAAFAATAGDLINLVNCFGYWLIPRLSLSPSNATPAILSPVRLSLMSLSIIGQPERDTARSCSRHRQRRLLHRICHRANRFH